MRQTATTYQDIGAILRAGRADGAYGEHQPISVRVGDRLTSVDALHFEIRLALGAGEQILIAVKCLVSVPTLRFPWERSQ